MKRKASVCLLDEDTNVGRGWLQALGSDVKFYHFHDHLELIEQANLDKDFIPSFSCIIMGRYFKRLDLDVISSSVPETLRAHGAQVLLLNWQGYVTKEEVGQKFEGKLFHRYGVKWQTLRLRIQKHEKVQKTNQLKTMTNQSQSSGESLQAKTPILAIKNGGSVEPLVSSQPALPRPMRCGELLKEMARRAEGLHREKIEHYVRHDLDSGRKLLEAIYDRLLADKNRPSSCPSQYINSSPVIAKRVLKEVLYG